MRSGKIEWKLEMSLACSPPAEGLNALNYTEKKKNQLMKLKKKKKTTTTWELSEDSQENNQ